MNNESYYPNKLMLSTFIALVALFSSVFGFIPAVIAKQMAQEIPETYNPVDRKRAINIATAAIIFAIIEFLAGIVLLIVAIADGWF